MLLFPQWSSECGIASYFTRKASTWTPLNLAYLAAAAEREGHTVKIIDGQVLGINSSEIVKQTVAFKPDLIGITGATPFYHISVNLAKSLREAGNRVPIVVGGTHITILKEEAFDRCFLNDIEPFPD